MPGADPSGAVVGLFTLEQNHPNPFNSATVISFSLPAKSFVSLKVFDALGRETATLASEGLSAGTYRRQWHAVNLPSGVYLCRLEAGTFAATKKLILPR
ncbi:MAG: T9SS type A sorting domain-containing protein [bacterium]|nr:T9SS type A sorting domain-containing protein [bacterium]